MLAPSIIAKGSALLTTDAAIRQITRIAGLPDQRDLILTLNEIERTFQPLAMVTLGRPAAQDNIPADAAFATVLLILREFMHHMAFASITVKADALPL